MSDLGSAFGGGLLSKEAGAICLACLAVLSDHVPIETLMR
jgi:hypothetical protein